MNKTLHLKECVFTAPSNKTLQELVAEAILASENLVRNKKKIDAGGECVRLLHRVASHSHALTGQFISFYPDHNKNVAALDDEATDLDLTEVEPPEDNEGHRQEFIEGLSWIYISENTVILVVSVHYGQSRIEEYLNWLINKYCWASNEDGSAPNQAVLSDPDLPKSLLENPKTSKVKSISIKSGIHQPKQLAPESGKIATGMNLDYLRNAMAAEDLDTQRLNEIIKGLDNSELNAGDYQVEIQVKDRRTRPNMEASPNLNLLTSLATAMRHELDERFAITLTDGSVIRGSQFKRVKSVNVRDSNGIPYHTDIIAKMAEWHQTLL